MVRRPISIVDLFNLELPFVTEFRRLLQKVRNAETGSELKALLFTSAMLSEGKSTVCAFLALTAAKHKGLKTLLIDCDLRRPSIHKFFAIRRSPGLSEVLLGGLSAEDAIRKTGIESLDIMTAGEVTSQPSEVFDAEAVSRLVEEMKFYYDLILVDTAPLLPVSDPMLLAPKMDGIVLVVKAGATQREVVHRAVEIIDASRHKILGVVLNNMNNSLPYYYDYSYYGYDYSPPPRKRRNSTGKRAERAGRNSRRAAEGGPATDSFMRRS